MKSQDEATDCVKRAMARLEETFDGCIVIGITRKEDDTLVTSMASNVKEQARDIILAQLGIAAATRIASE